ncbi:MAG: PilN domain-containing protein [Gammaproteobacteria bacterium]|nr:PilN domain-containing protein [Gammaproteobacteria bacterium]
MTALNLLPWRERRRQRRSRIFVVGLASSFTVAVAVLAVAWHITEGALEAARGQNAGQAERLAGLDSRLLELADVERGNTEIARRISALHRLDAERVEAVRVFAELASTLPPGLRYTTVARRGGLVSVRGTADAESSVSTFMRNLAHSARFQAPSLQNIADAADSGGRAMFDLSFETSRLPDNAAAPEPAHARD